MVRAGTSLIVFPEGTRSRDNLVHAFKKGPFAIAAQAGRSGGPDGHHRAPGRSPRRTSSTSTRARSASPSGARSAPPSSPGRDALLREVRRQIIEMDRAAGGPGGADEPAVAARGFEGDVGDAPDGR